MVSKKYTTAINIHSQYFTLLFSDLGLYLENNLLKKLV